MPLARREQVISQLLDDRIEEAKCKGDRATLQEVCQESIILALREHILGAQYVGVDFETELVVGFGTLSGLGGRGRTEASSAHINQKRRRIAQREANLRQKLAEAAEALDAARATRVQARRQFEEASAQKRKRLEWLFLMRIKPRLNQEVGALIRRMMEGEEFKSSGCSNSGCAWNTEA